MKTPCPNPVTALFQSYLHRRGLNRRDIGEIVSANRNRSKAFHKLSQLLRGDCHEPEFLREVAAIFDIPDSELEAAVREEVSRQREDEERRFYEYRTALMERRGPHLWRRLPPGYHPSLITVMGPAFFLLVPLPQDIVGRAEAEQFQLAGETARADFASEDRRCSKVAGYLYRRSAEDVFEIGTDGAFICRQEVPSFDGPASLRAGGKSLDGLGRLLAGAK